LPIFKADKVTLHVSRRKTGNCAWCTPGCRALFGVVATHRISALFVSADRFLVTHSEQIVTLASWTAVPAAYGWRQAVTRGRPDARTFMIPDGTSESTPVAS
jgi:hypothetical protein